LIIDEKGEFDQDIFVVSNNFRTKYEKNSSSVQWRPLWNGFNQEYDNNNKRRSKFEGKTLHKFNKGCG